MNQGMDILKSGDVLVENDRITAVGKLSCEQAKNSVVIDASGKLLMPGLINGHCHVPMTLLRSFADDTNLQTWLFEHIFPTEEKLTGEDVYWASLLGIMEMASSGITCFADMYFYMDDIAKAVDQSGIRAQLSRGVTCSLEGSDFSDNKGFNESIDFYRNWNGAANGRITAAFAPHAIYTCSTDYIWTIRDTAEKYNAPIHIHVDETSIEHEDSLKNFKRTPTQYLYDLGVFDLKTIAAHCVFVTDEDMAIFKEKGVSIVHNPSSNLKLASGIAPIPQAINHGINVMIGTDGASSNNNLNLFQEINLAALIHKGNTKDPIVVNCTQAVQMATINGARGLGLDDLGTIAPGNKADLILIDLEKPHLKPLHNPVSLLAYSVQGSDVCLNMVDGKIIYQNGEYLTIDREKVFYNIQKICDRIFKLD